MFKSSPSKSNLSLSKANLNNFDFSNLENNDPSFIDGYLPIYDQDIQFKIQLNDKNEETQDFPNTELLRVRIMVQGEEKSLREMKIELSSDNDLFFHFQHKTDEENYEQIKSSQNLNCKFIDYPAVCVKNFEKCSKDSNQQRIIQYYCKRYIPILTIMPDGQGRVEIIQFTEYKNVELIHFDFMSSDDEIIRNVISFKYTSVKQKLSIMEQKLKDINDIVKIKNPSLLLQIQKGSQYQQNRPTQTSKK